jgi:hypothetical protein
VLAVLLAKGFLGRVEENVENWKIVILELGEMISWKKLRKNENFSNCWQLLVILREFGK